MSKWQTRPKEISAAFCGILTIMETDEAYSVNQFSWNITASAHPM